MIALKQARKDLGLTQVEAAKGIGISVSMLMQMEGGFKNPSLDTMAKVAKFYQKTVDELFFAVDSHS